MAKSKPFEQNTRVAKRYEQLMHLSKQLGHGLLTKDLDDSLTEAMHKGVIAEEQAKQQLFDLVENDADLRAMMVQYGASRKTLNEIYRQLSVNVGQWAGGIYVPVGGLGANTSLRFILKALAFESQYTEADQWQFISQIVFEFCHNDTIDRMDEYFTHQFYYYASSIMDGLTDNEYKASSITNSLVRHKDFAESFMSVAISAADLGAIIQDKSRNERNQRRLQGLIEPVEKQFRWLRDNLVSHHEYTMNTDNEYSVSPPEMSGQWLLVSLSDGRQIDFSNQEMREAAKIVGKPIYDKFVPFWD